MKYLEIQLLVRSPSLATDSGVGTGKSYKIANAKRCSYETILRIKLKHITNMGSK